MTDPIYLSSDAVDAAARTAHGQVTYANIESGDPAYPFPEGGYWGKFMDSLEARWEQVQAQKEDSGDETTGQQRLIADGGRQNAGAQREWSWEDVERVLDDLKKDGYEVANFETSTSYAAPEKTVFLDVSRDEE